MIEPNRRRITGSIFCKPLISDLSVLIVCNKTGGTIKRRYTKKLHVHYVMFYVEERKRGPECLDIAPSCLTLDRTLPAQCRIMRKDGL